MKVGDNHSKEKLGNISEKIITLNEGAVKTEIKDLVRKNVEETLNEFLDNG